MLAFSLFRRSFALRTFATAVRMSRTPHDARRTTHIALHSRTLAYTLPLCAPASLQGRLPSRSRLLPDWRDGEAPPPFGGPPYAHTSMPKEQYMCQLCANHGVFNQPKKGHKQKCPHRTCPCELCGLNTKRRALDQIERQLKTASTSSDSTAPAFSPTQLTTALSSIREAPLQMTEASTASASCSNSPVNQSDFSTDQCGGGLSPMLSPLSAFPFFPGPLNFFPPPFLAPPPPATTGSYMLQSLILPPPSPTSASSPTHHCTATAVKHSAMQPGNRVHPSTPSSSPYCIPLPATISRKGMREALKSRSLSVAIENIRAKSQDLGGPKEEIAKGKSSIFRSVEQLAG